MRRWRLLRLGKWAGLILCVLLAAVWLASGWYQIAWRRVSPAGDGVEAVIAGGQCLAQSLASGAVGGMAVQYYATVPWYGTVDTRRTAATPRFPAQAWMLRWTRTTLPGGTPGWTLAIPLWAPFLLLALPISFLWWRGRRPRSGFCRCGYDLGGLEGRPCPECGRAEP